MTTMFGVYITGMGPLWQRRCDAGCYNATTIKCQCICGGVNHGVGLEKARANTKDITDEQIIKEDIKFNAGKGARTIIREQSAEIEI